MGTKTLRFYNVSDSEMLESADVMNDSFTTNLHSFIAFDSATFTVTSPDDFQAKIDTGINIDSDEQIVDEVKVETIDVHDKMKECQDFFDEMKYFIKNAFPNKKPIWNIFGFDNFDDDKNAPRTLQKFMYSLHKTATKYSPQLENAGFDIQKIPTIKTLGDELRQERKEQKNAMNNRPIKTKHRIESLNDIWSFMVKICNAAEKIYKNDPAMLNKFRLPEPPKPKNDKSSENDNTILST